MKYIVESIAALKETFPSLPIYIPLKSGEIQFKNKYQLKDMRDFINPR